MTHTTPLLHPFYTLITPLLIPNYTLITPLTPLLHPYTLITPLYTLITPLLHPYPLNTLAYYGLAGHTERSRTFGRPSIQKSFGITRFR
jgi:hypothetical protein